MCSVAIDAQPPHSYIAPPGVHHTKAPTAQIEGSAKITREVISRVVSHKPVVSFVLHQCIG